MPTALSVGPDKDKLNVFISYSRKDVEFSDQLVAALEAFGFTTTIDRKGIHGAENWEQRLGQLILEADVVVFVLTPASAASPVCKWEVDQALELKKRIVPVLAAPLDNAKPHEHLRDLNYIQFYKDPTVPGSGFGNGLARLAATLSVDIEWTREHTRLGALASRWQAGDRPVDLLLRGSELARLLRWRDSRPANGPELTTLQRAFLHISEDAEIARASEERKQIEERQEALRQAEDAQNERAKALRQAEDAQEERAKALREAEDAQKERTKVLKQMSRRTRYGVIAMSVLALISSLAAAIAYTQNQALQRASLRLQEGMKLKIADTDHVIIATEKWYRIATDYKLAIGVYNARLPESGEPGRLGTRFLVKGGGLRSEWSNQVVFVTTSHTIHSQPAAAELDLSQAYIVFPGIGETRLGVDKILFESKDLDVAVLSLAGTLPRQLVPVDLAGQIESRDSLDGVAVLQWTAQDGFALGFGHGINKPSTDGDNRMYYTYVTGPGASGAPVFDTNSGNVVCVHVGSVPGPPRLVGFCTSISKIVAAIRSK
jgi:cytochrome c-type biogenesis protein CcmH/NrfG